MCGRLKVVGMEDHLTVMVVAVGGAVGDWSSHSIGVHLKTHQQELGLLGSLLSRQDQDPPKWPLASVFMALCNLLP